MHIFDVLRRVAIGVTTVAGALWVALQTNVLHYGPRASTVVGSVAIASAALMPSLLGRTPTKPADESPKP